VCEHSCQGREVVVLGQGKEGVSVLIRLSFRGEAFLRTSCEAVHENGAIRVAGEGRDGVLLFSTTLRHADDIVVGRVALKGIWNALAREAVRAEGGKCILTVRRIGRW
jgi:hypothetical protein